MRPLLLSLLLVVTMFAAARADGWKRFTAPGTTASVSFPKPPGKDRATPLKNGGGVAHVFQAIVQPTVYQLSYIDYKNARAEDLSQHKDEILQGIAKGVQMASKGKLTGSREVMGVGGLRGYEFDCSAEKVTLRQRNFIVGTRIYGVTCIMARPAKLGKSETYFLTSFEVQ